MPNGEDRNWVRLVSVCAEYRNEYGQWPTRVDLLPGIRDNLNWIFGTEAFERLLARVELRPDPTVDYLRAIGAAGSCDYGGGGGVSPAARQRAESWLAEYPRPEIFEEDG